MKTPKLKVVFSFQNLNLCRTKNSVEIPNVNIWDFFYLSNTPDTKPDYMKYFFSTLFLFIFCSATYSQCILTTGSYTESDVETCLANCGCSTIVIPDGNTVSLDGDWDLTDQGDLTIEVDGSTGTLNFAGNGNNLPTLSLTAGSVFSFNGPFDDPAPLTSGNSQNEPRVIIGDDEFYAQCNGGRSCLDDLIDLFLPIKLSYLNVIDNPDSYARLEWETVSEVNNKGFAIYKNGVMVDFIEGNIDSSSPIQYHWNDHNYMNGQVKYQIIQFDIDGSIGYFSDLLSYEKEIEKAILFPNPVSDVLTILSPEDEVLISIIDAHGQMIRSIDGSKVNILQVNQLAKGLYIIEIRKNDMVLLTEKMIKQ